jgi:hypothetical protein
MGYFAIFVFTLFLISAGGCSGKQGQLSHINECNNTFVVSAMDGYRVFLFEHRPHDVAFRLIGEYSNGSSAFYSCEDHCLVMLQEAEKEGIKTIDILNNKQTVYETKSGFNGIVARGPDWFLYSTAAIRQARADVDKLGYIPPDNISPLSLSKSGKQKSLAYFYTEDRMFDLKKHRVVRTYPFGMWRLSELIGDDLYVFAGDFIRVNLKTGKAERLWDHQDEAAQKENGSYYLPQMSVQLFVNGVLYVVTSSESWDTVTKTGQKKSLKFKKGSLYKVENKHLSFVTKLPMDDIVYANSPDKKFLYIFTKSRKVIQYDIERNATKHIYNIPVDLNATYELGTVGFTNDNFIMAFEDDEYMDGYIVVTDRNFTRLGKPYRLDIGGIDISTEKSIHTNSYRRINL